MLGDLCTKALLGPRIKELLSMMSVQNNDEPSEADGGESATLQVGALKAVQSVECNTRSTSSRSGGDGSVVQALRAITAASLLHGVAAKLVKINIEIDEHEKIQLDENVHLLKSLCAVLVLVGLVALTAWKCCHRELNDAPEDQCCEGSY